MKVWRYLVCKRSLAARYILSGAASGQLKAAAQLQSGLRVKALNARPISEPERWHNGSSAVPLPGADHLRCRWHPAMPPRTVAEVVGESADWQDLRIPNEDYRSPLRHRYRPASASPMNYRWDGSEGDGHIRVNGTWDISGLAQLLIF